MSERSRMYAAKYNDYVYLIRLKALRSKMISHYHIDSTAMQNLDDYLAAIVEAYGLGFGESRILQDKMRRYYQVCIGNLIANKTLLREEFEAEGFDPLLLDVIEGLFATEQNYESVMNIDL